MNRYQRFAALSALVILPSTTTFMRRHPPTPPTVRVSDNHRYLVDHRSPLRRRVQNPSTSGRATPPGASSTTPHPPTSTSISPIRAGKRLQRHPGLHRRLGFPEPPQPRWRTPLQRHRRWTCGGSATATSIPPPPLALDPHQPHHQRRLSSKTSTKFSTKCTKRGMYMASTPSGPKTPAPALSANPPA